MFSSGQFAREGLCNHVLRPRPVKMRYPAFCVICAPQTPKKFLPNTVLDLSGVSITRIWLLGPVSRVFRWIRGWPLDLQGGTMVFLSQQTFFFEFTSSQFFFLWKAEQDFFPFWHKNKQFFFPLTLTFLHILNFATELSNLFFFFIFLNNLFLLSRTNNLFLTFIERSILFAKKP